MREIILLRFRGMDMALGLNSGRGLWWKSFMRDFIISFFFIRKECANYFFMSRTYCSHQTEFLTREPLPCLWINPFFSSCFSTLLLKPCYRKQENYNKNLAPNFVGGQLDICKYNEFGRKVGAESISAPVSLADMESAPTVFTFNKNRQEKELSPVLEFLIHFCL